MNPGFGLTEAPPDYDFTPGEHSEIVENVVAGLELTSLTLVVQDWGGPVGLGFAGRNPGLVDRLVIGNTFAWPLQGDLGVAMKSCALAVGAPVVTSVGKVVAVPLEHDKSLRLVTVSQCELALGEHFVDTLPRDPKRLCNLRDTMPVHVEGVHGVSFIVLTMGRHEGIISKD